MGPVLDRQFDADDPENSRDVLNFDGARRDPLWRRCAGRPLSAVARRGAAVAVAASDAVLQRAAASGGATVKLTHTAWAVAPNRRQGVCVVRGVAARFGHCPGRDDELKSRTL